MIYVLRGEGQDGGPKDCKEQGPESISAIYAFIKGFKDDDISGAEFICYR